MLRLVGGNLGYLATYGATGAECRNHSDPPLKGFLQDFTAPVLIDLRVNSSRRNPFHGALEGVASVNFHTPLFIHSFYVFYIITQSPLRSQIRTRRIVSLDLFRDRLVGEKGEKRTVHPSPTRGEGCGGLQKWGGAVPATRY
ncbi:MAG: hypothetical protein KME26_02935 [Oscillatoria princeps RMCB-10]|jgi:hypothetical protein|nr:hypothetical protein [Oscillatoria princeps RMCB-10]